MSKQLVVYISATGTTRRVAQNLAKAIDADLAEIVPVPPFTAQDIDWTDPTSRASRQHADRAMRPPISASPSADGYDEIFVGYPLWWDTAPREVRTWLESHDFTGKTITTFATSSSSTRGALGEQLHDSGVASPRMPARPNSRPGRIRSPDGTVVDGRACRAHPLPQHSLLQPEHVAHVRRGAVEHRLVELLLGIDVGNRILDVLQPMLELLTFLRQYLPPLRNGRLTLEA